MASPQRPPAWHSGLLAPALLTATVLLAVVGTAAADWPMFRLDPARTGTVAEAQVTGLEVAWAVELAPGGSVDSSPAVVGQVVYVGDSLGVMHALSAADGSERWRFQTGGAVVSSPAVAGGLVLFGSVDRFLYALRAADGGLAWCYRTRGPVLSSPAVAGDTVVFGSMDGRLCALSLADGAVLWRTEPGAGIQGAPAIAGDTVLHGDDVGRMRALSLADGSVRWELALRPESASRMSWRAEAVEPGAAGADAAVDTAGTPKVVAAPVVAGDVVVFALMGPSALRPPKLDYLVGLDLATGEQRWAANEAFSVLGSPLVADGHCYFVTVEGYLSKTVARALRLADGEFAWERQVGGAVDSSPALLGGAVCFGCHDGSLYLLNAADGAIIARAALATKVYSSPAFSDGRIYIGANDGRLHCLQSATADGFR